MRKYPYWASSVLLFSIFVLTIFYYAGDRNNGGLIESVQGQFPAGTTAPFETVNTFYKAVESGDSATARMTVTPALWSALQSQGFFRHWEEQKKIDPSLIFDIFLVSDQSINEQVGVGWVFGGPHWRANKLRINQNLVTIHLAQINGKWLIKRIDSRSPVEVASLFYQAVNDGRIKDMQALTTRSYWNMLTASGIIGAYERDRQSLSGKVYLVFEANDFAEGSKAWVTGSTIWAPTTDRAKELAVTVEFVKDKGLWKINNIIGHWKIKK
ncbi:MAG: hypothetical protein ACYCX4_00700 [Bacillota bacterium]